LRNGAGVGLTIAKKITELMGGKISCKSIYGKESRFGIKILLKKKK
jgi:signal transduction histidine kinase